MKREDTRYRRALKLTPTFPSHYPSNIPSTTHLFFPCWWKHKSGVKEETTTYLLQTCTSVSSAKSKSVKSRWCMGDHLNSGIRNIVVRGPGLNCRRCSSVIGIPRNPKSTRKSLSCWVTDRPCTAYINKKFKNYVNFLWHVFEWITEFEKGWGKTGLEHKLQEILVLWSRWNPSVKELLQFESVTTEGLSCPSCHLFPVSYTQVLHFKYYRTGQMQHPQGQQWQDLLYRKQLSFCVVSQFSRNTDKLHRNQCTFRQLLIFQNQFIYLFFFSKIIRESSLVL